MINQLIDSGKLFNSPPDIQETNFSLDGIARFVCNTFKEVEDAQEEGQWQFDAIIVGSGMYGGYAASKLYQFNKDLPTERRPRILVLEGGPFLVSEHFQNLTRVGEFFNTVNKPIIDENQSFLTQIDPGFGEQRQALQPMSPHHRCVGGKSLFWGGWSPRLTDEDFNRFDDDGNRFWPKEVVDYLNSDDGYKFIEEQIGVEKTADFVNGDFNDALRTSAENIIDVGTVPSLNFVDNAPIAVQAQSPESGLFSYDKFSSPPLLFDSIRQDAERSGGSNGNRFLFLVPNAQVLKLETDKGYVKQVVILLKELSTDPNNPGLKERIARLDLKQGAMVFLAGNTINSTRLALNSFPKPSTLGTELMGKNLMAHVRGNYYWRIHRTALNFPNDVKKFATAALHIAGETNVNTAGTRPKIGHFHFQFYALGSLTTNPEEFLYRFIPHLDDIQKAQQAVDATNINDWIVIGNRTCGEMFGNRNANTSQFTNSFISVNPFGGAGDDVYFENGNQIRIPKAFISLIETNEDKLVREAQKDAAFDFAAALAGEPANASRQEQGDKIQFIKRDKDGKQISLEDPIGSTYHESGTLWIGEDPSSSVTDVHGHFHHVANAYCLDQSLFPTVGSANPVPTSLALSQMIVRHVSNRFSSTPLQPAEPDFTSIFDGNLNGWQFFGAGNIQPLPGLSIIEAGTPGVESVLGFIRFETNKFKNFILKLDWKAFSLEANSGIFLRMPDIDRNDFDTLYSNSIEIQIDETGKFFDLNRDPQTIYGSSLHKTGAIYNIAPATRWESRAVSPRGQEGNWNSFEIHVEDAEISVFLNKELVSHHNTLEDKYLNEGYIALQCHTDVVQFRNIRIREI